MSAHLYLICWYWWEANSARVADPTGDPLHTNTSDGRNPKANDANQMWQRLSLFPSVPRSSNCAFKSITCSHPGYKRRHICDFLKWFALSCKWGTSQPTKFILSQCETRAWHNGVFLQFDYVLLHVWVETWKKIYQTQCMQLSSFIIWMVAELYHRDCIVATIRDAYCS